MEDYHLRKIILLFFCSLTRTCLDQGTMKAHHSK